MMFEACRENMSCQVNLVLPGGSDKLGLTGSDTSPLQQNGVDFLPGQRVSLQNNHSARLWSKQGGSNLGSDTGSHSPYFICL